MKKFISLISCFLVCAILANVSPIYAVTNKWVAPSETNAFVSSHYTDEIDQDAPFFDVILPKIRKNIKENNKHTVTPYYDKLPVSNNPENFQGLGHTTYANINGKTVTAEAFYRVRNEGLYDPNCGMGLLIYQCIEYKRKHPKEDVKITFSSYRTSVTAAVCVIPESKYYGYMRSLYGTNYDEQGFVRISYMFTEAARMGIEVTLVNQLDSYGVLQHKPGKKKLVKRANLSHKKYFEEASKGYCYDAYAKGKKVSDFLNPVSVEWKVQDITSDMQHVKSASVSHYLATDGKEHKNAVYFGSANLDENNYIGANGNNSSQSGVIVSDHSELYRVTYNYMQLMARYPGQEDMFLLRKYVNELNNKQLDLILSGKENEIPKDEQIVYLGSKNDKVFELYFTPLGGGADAWDTKVNPICKYGSKLPKSKDYVEVIWNEFGYGNCHLGDTLSKMMEDAYCKNPNVKNKISLHVDTFNTDEIQKLTVGSQIGYRSINDGANIHSKDLLFSYEEGGKRHNVSIMTSCNFYMIAFNYRTNSILVINETEETGGNFYKVFGEKYSYGMIDNDLMVDPSAISLEVGKSYTVKATYSGSKKLTWKTKNSKVATVKNGKITAKGVGETTVTVTDGKHKATVKVTVTECKGCHNYNKGLTCSTDWQYVTNRKVGSLPNTFTATFSVEKKDLKGTTTFIGNDGSFDTSFVFSINKSGQPRVAIRDVAGYNTQKVYIFKKVDVATGEKVNLTISINKSKKKMYCYVNGELKQTISTGKIKSFTEKHNTVIGGDHLNGNSTFFPGWIESVAVWSDLRTSTEVASDYKNGINYNDKKLLLAYDFTKCEKHRVKDLSLNENNLEKTVFWQSKNKVKPVTDFEYSFAVVGDTQTMCEKDPEAMESLYDWILENQKEQKIEYVIGLGDITDDSTDGEWEKAQAYISKLNGKIPYSLTRGNHDDWDDFNRNLHNGYYEKTIDGMMNSGKIELTDINQPGLLKQVQPDGTIKYITREEDEPEGGTVVGDLTNSYRYFSVQGTNYLIMTLDFAPSSKTLKWASSVIKAHPKHKVIITTHAYMYRDGTTISDEDCYPPTYYSGYKDQQNGDDMWKKCFSKYDNVLMVLSGHDPWQHVVYRQDKGDKGNIVTQFLIDAQYVDLKNGSTAMVAMFYFSNEGKTLTVRYYSVEKDCYGSPLSQFTIDLDKHKHTYDDVSKSKATLKSNGKLGYYCTTCGHKKSVTINKPETLKFTKSRYVYDGKEKTPSVIIKDKNGKKLTKGTDYLVTYAEDCKAVGPHKATVNMIGDYSGTKTLTYKIEPISIKKCSVKLKDTTYTYNGRVKTPSVIVKNAKGTRLTKNTHYTVKYSSGRKGVGTYSVTVKMKGNYSGTKKLTFKIVPKETAIKSLKAGTKAFTVKYSKQTSGAGYEVQYSTSSKFKKAKTKTVKGNKTTSLTVKKLSAKKTYYVRVRTCKTVSGKKHYSAWTKAKKVKTK